MTPEETLIDRIYRIFNARDLDGALAFLHPQVVWPNGMEGGVVEGHAGVRAYWTRQWQQIDPHVEPRRVAVEAPGRIRVEVHQVVRDLDGRLLAERTVQHVYQIEDGLIRRMQIE